VSPHEWDVEALAALVEVKAGEHPEQAEEWRGYVEFLRQQAVGGALPAGFDALVQDVFGPILPADPQREALRTGTGVARRAGRY
jgi:hypothetical protein